MPRERIAQIIKNGLSPQGPHCPRGQTHLHANAVFQSERCQTNRVAKEEMLTRIQFESGNNYRGSGSRRGIFQNEEHFAPVAVQVGRAFAHGGNNWTGSIG